MKSMIYSSFKTRCAAAGILLAMLCVFSGCEDFLTTPSQSQLTTDNFYQTPTQIDQALTGVYGCLRPFSKYWYCMSEYRSDNMFIITEARQNDNADCAQFNSTGLLTDNLVNSCWADHYTLIAAANTLLDRMEANGVEFTSDEIRAQYEAETRFLRALAYFDLVRFFGRVPVSVHEISVHEAFRIKQSEDYEIYDKVIVPDLQYACEHLHEKAIDHLGQEHSERASLMAAKALLGKVYMQMAGYPLYRETKDLAENLFREVLDYSEQGHYWISRDWDHLWISDNDNQYFIFEVQYASELNLGNPVAPLSRGSNYMDDQYCHGNLTGGPHAYVSRLLLDHFLQMQPVEGDTTGALEFIDKRMTWAINTGAVYDEETGGMISDVVDGNKYMFKFFENKLKRAALGYSEIDSKIITSTYWPQNFPVLRIEDVALLYAECVGPTAEGYKYLNRIREKAGLQPLSGLSSDAFQQAVVKERQYELLGEGHRWFDEVRQNTFINDLQTMFFDYRDNRDRAHSEAYTIYANRVVQTAYLYPIPHAQIQVRDGLYTQNPGY